MPDIALLGERTFLFEKLFEELGAECQFLQVSALGSPFLPRYKMLVVPTGFANPQYSKALQSLTAAKSRIAEFIKGGGVLTVYGALVPEHNYDWLPLPLKYVCDYGPQKIRKQECEHRECACVTCTETPECDGYLVPGRLPNGPGRFQWKAHPGRRKIRQRHHRGHLHPRVSHRGIPALGPEKSKAIQSIVSM